MTTWTTESKIQFPTFDSIVYLTGVTTPGTVEAAAERRATHPFSATQLGLLATPASATHSRRDLYEVWAADNGCFAESKNGVPFDPARWLAWLAECGPDNCLFAALPDVLNWHGDIPVGDPVATWERSAPYVGVVREMGFPVAIVLQDGVENEPLLWLEILEQADAVFIGGSDHWKLGETVPHLIAEARENGLWVHAGRVNSYKRLKHFSDAGAHSADGTFVKYSPKVNVPRMLAWFDKLALEAA